MIPLISKSPRAKKLALLRSLGASTWLSGVQNYSDFAGTVPAVQDGIVAYAADLSMGLYPATQGTTAYCPILRKGALNQLLNSATLSTQNVSVYAVPYILSFYGTGTVTLSGAFSGSLVGTGAGNRVYLAFTPTAGTLTLTVSGSVTSAMLEWVVTTPSVYVATTTTPLSNGVGNWWWHFQDLNAGLATQLPMASDFFIVDSFGRLDATLYRYMDGAFNASASAGFALFGARSGVEGFEYATSGGVQVVTSSTPLQYGSPLVLTARMGASVTDMRKNGAQIISAPSSAAVTAPDALFSLGGAGANFGAGNNCAAARYGVAACGSSVGDSAVLNIEKYLGALAGVSL